MSAWRRSPDGHRVAPPCLAGREREDVGIHHIVLKRLNGSELRQNFIATSGDPPRLGSVILLAISNDAPSLPVQAKVTAVEKLSFVPRDGRELSADVTVRVQELIYVPVADNDP
jgi:hypothetical protein